VGYINFELDRPRIHTLRLVTYEATTGAPSGSSAWPYARCLPYQIRMTTAPGAVPLNTRTFGSLSFSLVYRAISARAKNYSPVNASTCEIARARAGHLGTRIENVA
jgi:hypothetical protein